jgi:hypothetical protein
VREPVAARPQLGELLAGLLLVGAQADNGAQVVFGGLMVAGHFQNKGHASIHPFEKTDASDASPLFSPAKPSFPSARQV